MQIYFQTKEDSNRIQTAEFLKLSGTERFQNFLNLSRKINLLFPPKEINNINPNNFIIHQKSKK